MKFTFLAKNARELSCNSLVMRKTKSDKWVKYALKVVKKDVKTASKAAKTSSSTILYYPNDSYLRNFLGWNVRFKRPEVSHKLIQHRLEEALKEAGYTVSIWFDTVFDKFYIYLQWNCEGNDGT